MSDYDDIINLEKPVSHHPKMSLYDRAAQFAPFAALKGYEAKINDKGRITQEKIELSQNDLSILNKKINLLIDNINLNPYLEIVYFVKDKTKDGGEYIKKETIIKKIDVNSRLIILPYNVRISFDDILDIKSNLFEEII